MRYLPFIPHRALELHTRLTPGEVRDLLREQSEPGSGAFEGLFDWLRSDAPVWRGEVEARSFRLRRVIRYRNSFVPILVGNIEAAGSGATVRIVARPHGFVLAFMTLWIGFALFWTAAAIATGGGLVSLAGLGMAAFGYSVMTGAFLYEMGVASDLLRSQLPPPVDVAVGPFRSPTS